MTSYRKLLPTEAGQLLRHLLALTPVERRMRFQGAVSDDAIASYVRRIDWFRTMAIGYFVDGRLRGVAELVAERAVSPRAGEIAVTVETQWQGSGVGTALIQRIVTAARNRLLRRVTMTCLIENQPMRHIADKFNGARHFAGPALMVDLDLADATPWTMAEELVQDTVGGLAAINDRLLAPSSR